MGIEESIIQAYPIECKGRNEVGDEVLDNPVTVDVVIHKRPGSDMISSNVECQYNVGSHGGNCKASHPDLPKTGKGVGCPYAFDIPYALEINNDL